MSKTIQVSLSTLAKTIDHSLLHPTFTDADVLAGIQLAKSYNVATACIKPYHIPLAKKELSGSSVLICPVIAFPHGNSTTEVKVFEANAAAEAGGQEIDMVVNIGKVLSGDWEYVTSEIRQINEAVTKHGAILKVAFVKTSTGYGFVKQSDGSYNYKGATPPHLKIMREHSAPEVQIKAAGGVRTLDDLLYVMSLGVTRIGATATAAILEEAKQRGIGEELVTVEVKVPGGLGGGY
ncbi:hypothetical protein TWF703_005578 [Orbilia oligospora]|uniref:Uncharacterized protein n=1 Tax=Orbilia oligospora TaxID=2813651 RepID=A0A7C8P142_ORBOL|nr:hypothetical protein TWF703_005578 [Orbilia oligospora]